MPLMFLTRFLLRGTKPGFSNIKSIKSVKSGIAKRFVSTAGHKEWKIIRRPPIEFVYE